MKAKFTSGVTPFRGKYQGGVYQSFSAGNQILSNKRNSRGRYPNQYLTAAIMAKVTRAWAFLASGERDSWNGWAATYPQPCRYRSGCYLTGYQNFLQRNFYELLFFGINAPLITSPALSVVADSEVTPTLARSGSDLLLNYNWSRSGGDIWAGVFVSHIVSGGKLYNLNYPRFVGVIDNGGGFIPLYGCLYNWYANFPSTSYLSSNDTWLVPSYANFTTLYGFLGGVTVAGGKMKETGTTYWASPNTGASNVSKFCGRASGLRASTNGFFSSLLNYCYLRVAEPNKNVKVLSSANASLGNGLIGSHYKVGIITRLMRSPTPLLNGETGSYSGNDGKVYPTICIGNQEWLAANLCETKFRDGSDIPYISDDITWKNLTSPGMCYYNNDISNAFSSGSTSADISEGWGRNFGVLPNIGDYLILRFVKVGKLNGQFLGEEQFTIPVS